MANQNDSFIDEVTEDLRRDRLFGLFRRYGWIGLALILLLVGGVSYREYSQSRAASEAQGWGDAILAAEASGDPSAMLKVDADGSEGRAALAAMLAAGGWVEAGARDAAADALKGVVSQTGTESILHDLAELKLVMLNGPAMNPADRDAALTRLSRAGAPFELLALEQKAVALVEAGRTDDAITLIRQIQQKDGLSEALRRRLSEMMIALGVEPQTNDEVQAG
ncbi:tetratricopeptide repeat protein [Paracoccus spongiarum]|uniref:Tetratricopeptide repeat protein n=1 Tax=Paracoccus spongiarum TaxID=3064387 RepID=A0ABT9JCU5_9RHOB|nr:tetratricopeptide repeat protein [Paracoccus sp. 2205BS29-5]MDP5307504.1 tetratricopeptide repeat protein [Paracoccus sp. 2205BS29-5]